MALESKGTASYGEDFIGDLPDLPPLEGLKREDRDQLKQWWIDVRTVLRRQSEFIEANLK